MKKTLPQPPAQLRKAANLPEEKSRHLPSRIARFGAGCTIGATALNS
jgi:hypothetical protein